MGNKYKSITQTVKDKGFYFTAALAFAVIIASVVISYYVSDRTPAEAETTTEAETVFSLPAEADKEDVPDERFTITQNEISPAKETQTLPEPQTTEAEPEQTTQAAMVNKEYVLPSGGAVTKWFSLETQQYSKTMGDWRVHLGIDFSGEEGDYVYSVGNGKVSKVVSDTKWGYIIEIDYGEFTVRYCGINQEGAVGIDRKVSAGEVIGKLSQIPCESLDGPHLHLEVIKDGVNIDPAKAIGAF